MHRRASPLDAKRMRHVAATVLVAVLGELDVDGGEQREDVGLDDADHDLHEVDDDEDVSICSVDGTGVVKAEGSGTAYVSTTYNGISYQCIVRCNLH